VNRGASALGRLLAVAALVASGVMGAVAFGGPADALTLKIVCKSISRPAGFPTWGLGSCNGTTGGQGAFDFSPFAPPGGTITIFWRKNTRSTKVKFATCSGEGCLPGVDKTPDGSSTCPAGSTEFEAKGKVTADNTGSATVGGVAKAEVCVDSSGGVSLEPGTKFKI
jgi:hypothetical protein